jgi:hypothetical protein
MSRDATQIPDAQVSVKIVRLAHKNQSAHEFLSEYSYKGLKLAQLLRQLGVFLTVAAKPFSCRLLSLSVMWITPSGEERYAISTS